MLKLETGREPTAAGASLLRSPLSSFVQIYLPTVLCFLVINVTNATILGVLKRHGLLYGRDPSELANQDKTVRFFLVPLKSLLFFVGTAVLLTPLVRAFSPSFIKLFTRQALLKTLASLGTCLVLTASLFPLSFGRQYARISTDPFNQDVGQLYRRLLIPGLANLYHLDGFFYSFVFWAIVLVAALVTRFYFAGKEIHLSCLEEISLLTVGIFAASFQTPGYPEVAVLLLGLVSLIEFEKDGDFTGKQLAAFTLALMAHEACAVIIFAPMILFFFGRTCWLPTLGVATLYGISVLANFSFNIFTPFHLQTTVSDIPAHVYFWRSPLTIAWAAAFAFKLLWLVLFGGLYSLVRHRRPREAWFVVAGVALAAASTYIAVDYSRLIGFATIPLLLCFAQAKRHMPGRLFQTVVALNILIPSFFIGGNTGLLTFKGLYYIAYRLIFKLPPPRSG